MATLWNECASDSHGVVGDIGDEKRKEKKKPVDLARTLDVYLNYDYWRWTGNTRGASSERIYSCVR